jgi:tetratricopeptide (TPR) repeat protein
VLFGKGLEECQRLLSRSQWKEAQARVRSLLVEHEGKDYVRLRRAEIEEDWKRCAFRLAYKEPDPKTLISGELLAWNRKSGEVRIRYAPGKLQDFQWNPKEEDPLYVHPARFRGPYAFEISGNYYLPERYRGTTSIGGIPIVLVGMDDQKAFQAVFGHKPIEEGRWILSQKATIRAFDENGKRDLAVKDRSPVVADKPYAFRVSVTSGEIALTYRNERFLSARKPAGVWGRVGVVLPEQWNEIVLKGEVEDAWLQGLLDAAASRALAEFEKGFDPRKELPSWLFAEAAAPVASATVSAVERALPGPVRPEQATFIETASRYLDQEEFLAGLDYVRGARDGAGAGEEVRAFFLARFLASLGETDEALRHCDRVRELDPEFVEARRLRAEILARARRRADAIAECRNVLSETTGKAEDYQLLALLLLVEGKLDQAKEAIDRANAASVRSNDLAQLERIVVKARKGPNWSKVHEYESRYFRVRSDMDRNTCIEASKILEESYLAYTLRLRKVPDLERTKFFVYLFSGQSTYQDYAKDLGTNPRHSAGMYSLLLKQLLIWNLPNRDEMMRTVRHEGFHMYLDRLTDQAPPWFNEGLAEYYETASVVGGKWTQGQVHTNDLAVLRHPQASIVPLERFIRGDAESFYTGNVGIHYAQAWGLVHFLQHSTKENQAIFSRLFDALAAGASRRAAIDRAFAGVDLAALQREFEAYIASLR